MSVLDRNANGKLEAEEIDLAVASLRKLDRNRDGEVDSNELASRPHGGKQPSKQGPVASSPLFANLDKNKDGKLSLEEAPEHMRASFQRMDKNSDGYIDKKEQQSLLNLLLNRGKPRSGEGNSARQKGPSAPKSGTGLPASPKEK